jgi:MoxR-like ATPase
MIPKNITSVHIINAIQEIESGRQVPPDREPHKYQLVYKGKRYPPKFVISLANKYANGKELPPHEFSGGDETNPFLKASGFEVVLINDEPTGYDDKLREFLLSKFNISVERIKRSWLKLPSETILYVNGSRAHERDNEGWYDLEKDLFEELIGIGSSCYAIVLGDPSKTFVLPSNVVRDAFGGQTLAESAQDVNKKPRWMYTIQNTPKGYTLRINRNQNSDLVIEGYLNKWEQLPDFRDIAQIVEGLNSDEPRDVLDEQEHDFAPILKRYLESSFPAKIAKIARANLQLPSGAIIHGKGSRNHSEDPRIETYWFGLDRDIYNDFIGELQVYLCLVLDRPETTYVLPKEKVAAIFQGKPTKKRPGRETERWLFAVRIKEGKCVLKLNNVDESHDITSYLNKWNQIADFADATITIPKVFVTGYSESNLEHSIRYKTLGWRNQSNLLSEGAFVFVYNKDSHKIQAAFKALSKSNDDRPIWDEEKKSERQKLEFPYRWNAELVCNNLDIDLASVNNFEPFNGQATQKFIPLIGNNFPTPLTDNKYAGFRQFLLDSCNKDMSGNNIDSTDTKYWKIATGREESMWEEQLANGVTSIGWNELGDLSHRHVNEILTDIKRRMPDTAVSVGPQFKDFLSIKVGDIIIANKGFSTILGIGRVVGSYKYRPDLTFHHTYPVEWYDISEREIPPQTGVWMKTVSPVSRELYELIIKERESNYLLFRHQPGFKRKKNEREYWNDLLGKEYHFGKTVVNHKKVRVGTKTIWFYTDKEKIYLWGRGEVSSLRTVGTDEFVATSASFDFFNRESGVEASPVIQSKIKALKGWNPQNSIIEINRDIYEDLVANPQQLEIFDDGPLSIPAPEEIEDGYERISEELLIPKEKVIEIVTALASGRHVLLAGPIGSGKTHLARLIPEVFWSSSGGYFAEYHTATADWSTQDVIGGIIPKMDNGRVVYDIQYGCVVDTVSKNWERELNGGKRIQSRFPVKRRPFRGTWLVIDEFNRADIDKAFGQLFTALRTGSLKIPINEIGRSYKTLQIPQDYRIIGTLNTADKHFLFQLSDALKSRFAYIEIDIPSTVDLEKEIYYAMKKAIGELKLKDYADYILINEETMRVLAGKSNPDFFNRVLQAYYVLELIRVFKKLGTAILQVIYQNMLAGTRITKDNKLSIDNAITSTLMPQMENMPLATLGAIEALYDGDIVQYFKSAYRGPNRQSYAEVFEKTLMYLEIKDYVHRSEEYGSGNLKMDDQDLWSGIQAAAEIKRKNFESDLNQFKSAIADLRKSAVI